MTYFPIKGLVVLVFAIVSGAAAVANRLWGPRAQARRRLRAGSAAIADRSIVTVTGTVRPPAKPLIAPLSGKSCVTYEALGRLYEGKGRQREPYATLDARAMIPFELDVDGQIITIDGTAAELEMRPGVIIPRKLDLEIAFVIAGGYPRKYVPHGDFEEAAIEAGDKISVQGMAIVETDVTVEQGYRGDGARKVRIVAHEDHPLTIGEARR
jgi:hypothetical protein